MTKSKQWGRKLWVQKGYKDGAVLIDTDPEGDNLDSLVELTPAQVVELIEFLRSDG